MGNKGKNIKKPKASLPTGPGGSDYAMGKTKNLTKPYNKKIK